MKKLLVVFFVIQSALTAQNFKLRTEFSGTADKSGEENHFTAQVLNNMGNEIYSIEKTIQFDEPVPSAEIFSDGGLCIIYSLRGELEFYSSGGQLLSSRKIDKSTKPEYERSIYSEIKGARIALLISGALHPSYSKLLVLNNSGAEILSRQIEIENGGGIAFLTDNLIGVSGYSWTTGGERRDKSEFYNTEGELLFSVPDKFGGYDFHPENNLFLGFDKLGCFSADISDKKIISTIELKNEIIIDGKISAGGIFLLTAKSTELKDGIWKFKNAELVEFNSAGRENNRRKLRNEFSIGKLINLGGKITANLDGKEINLNE